jgi:predicted transcriptional regulator
MANRERMLEIAAEIVSAHVSNNAVPTDQLPALIKQVFNTLATVEKKTAEPLRPDPAVPINQSINRSGPATSSAWSAASSSR